MQKRVATPQKCPKTHEFFFGGSWGIEAATCTLTDAKKHFGAFWDTLLHNIAYGLQNIENGLHNIADGLHNIDFGLHTIETLPTRESNNSVKYKRFYKQKSVV